MKCFKRISGCIVAGIIGITYLCNNVLIYAMDGESIITPEVSIENSNLRKKMTTEIPVQTPTDGGILETNTPMETVSSGGIKETEYPVSTEPVSECTESPISTELPEMVPPNGGDANIPNVEATKEVFSTITPVFTSSPIKTEVPIKTASPAMTEVPIKTDIPSKTKTPIKTKEPVKTVIPEPTLPVKETICPTSTMEVERTSSPVKTLQPVKTISPIYTVRPIGTETPGNTGNNDKPVMSQTPSHNTNMGYCQITYQLNGGQNHKRNPQKIKKKGVSVVLNAPRKSKYTFVGWYTDPKYKNKVTTVGNTSLNFFTLYAKWKKVKINRAVFLYAEKKGVTSILLRVKKERGVVGFEYVYAKDPRFKRKYRLRTKKNPKTLSKLTKKKTYYIKVRAYKLDSTGKKIYGKYSRVKRVKI